MKRLWTTVLIMVSALMLWLTVISCGNPSTADSEFTPRTPSSRDSEIKTARVVIDTTELRHRVSPLIFGMHIEWVENGLGLLDSGSAQLRPEVLDLFLPLQTPLFRFPGGIHADYYDWRLGVGPVGSRGRSRNIFTKKTEQHRFGSPEFMALLEATGAEGLVTANFGTGTAREAGEWAAYLRDNGGRVGLWEVGNETYLTDPKTDGPNGREIFRKPEDYAAAFPEYRKAIRAATPDAKVGAIAHIDTGAFPLAPSANSSWTEEMLRGLKVGADFIAVHNAYAPVILDDSVDFARAEVRSEAYRSLYAAAEQTAENLEEVAEMVARLSPANKDVPLAVTEFGPFFGLSAKRKIHAQYVDQTRTLAAALYVASVLHVLIEDSRVFMACYTNPIHQWFGSLITNTDDGLITTPSYHLYALYRSRFERRLVETTVVSPAFSARPIGIVREHSGVPDLVAQSSISDDGRRLTVMIVNRSLDHALRTTVVVGGFNPATVDCRILTASSPAAINGPALSKSTLVGEEISPQELACTVGAEIVMEIPPSAIVSLVAEAGVTETFHPEGP